MNKYNRDIDLVIGYTYSFIPNPNDTKKYTFRGIKNFNRLEFSDDENIIEFSYFPYDYGERYWKLIGTYFKFGR